MQFGDGDQPPVDDVGRWVATLSMQPSQIGTVCDLSRLMIVYAARADHGLGGEQRHLGVVGDEHRLPGGRFGNTVTAELQPDLLDAVELDESSEGIAEGAAEQCCAYARIRHTTQYRVEVHGDCADRPTPRDTRAARIATAGLPPR